MRGLDYDRTNYEEFSKPVPKETSQRALELLGDAWRDPGLALPPLTLLKRAAVFDDDVYKWGLASDYDLWLEGALQSADAVHGRRPTVTSLRWYDTLAWLEGDNSAVLSALTEKLLRPLPSSEVLETATASAWLERLRLLLWPIRRTRRRLKKARAGALFAFFGAECRARALGVAGPAAQRRRRRRAAGAGKGAGVAGARGGACLVSGGHCNGVFWGGRLRRPGT